MSLLDQVKQYLRKGWSLLPTPRARKASNTKGWQKKEFSAQDFSDDMNVAVKCGEPSGGLVCVDLDDSVAVALAHHLSSDLIEGRPSKPGSHRFYIAHGMKSESFKFKKDGQVINLGEIKSTGTYVMLPPSLHESGEVRAWEAEGQPPVTDAERLRTATVYLMIMSLVVHCWPAKGVRHDLAAALAGFLMQLGIPPENVVTILTAAWSHTEDDEVEDRIRYAKNTVAQFESGEPCTGGPRVAEALGQDFVNAIRKWLKRTDTDIVKDLNQDWFMVDVGAETVVGNEIQEADPKNPDRKWTRYVFRSFEDFKRRLIKAPMVLAGFKPNTEDPIYVPLAKYWLEHPLGRQYTDLVYAPEGSGVTVGAKDLNGWKGFTVEPAPGDWSPIRSFILDVICAGDERALAWVLNWMAALFQRPGQHGETGLVLIGPEGAGKNFFLEMVLSYCFDGRHAKTIVGSADPVLGSFNDALSGLVLLILDEVHLTDAQSAALRGVVTAHQISVNRKNVARNTERSMLHFALASNKDVALKLNKDDRRFTVCQVSKARVNDHDYFAGLLRCLDAGGRAAMLDDLMRASLDDHQLRRAYDTEVKDEMKVAGLKPQETAVLNWLVEGSLFEERIAKQWLFKVLRGERHQPTDDGWSDVALGKLIRNIFLRTTSQKIKDETTTDSGPLPFTDGKALRNAYDFGGRLDDCRRDFEAYAQVTIDWETGAVVRRRA